MCISTITYTPHSASRASSFSWAFVDSSVSAWSTRGSSKYPTSSWLSTHSARSSSSVRRNCDSSQDHTPHVHFTRGCFACGGTSSVVGSAARLVGVDDLIRAFGVGVGNTLDMKNIRTHHSLRLTSRIGRSLSFTCCGIPLGDCVDDDDEDDLSLGLLDLSSVGSSCTGGKAGARVRAVHLVPNTRAFPVCRGTMKFLNGSSVPDFGLFSLPLRHFSSQQCARASSLTYLTRSFCPTQCPLMESRS